MKIDEKLLGQDNVKHFLPLLRFEIIYRLIALIIILPLCSFIIDMISKIFDYDFLSYDIVATSITDIRVWPFIIFTIIFFSAFILIEIVASLVIYYNDENTTFSLVELLLKSCAMLKRCFKLRNIFIFPIAIYLGIFTFFQSTVSNKLQMPIFIKEFIIDNSVLRGLYYFGIFVLGCIAILMIFVFNEFFIRKQSFMEALKKSITLVKAKFIYIGVLIMLFRLVLFLISHGLSLIFSEIVKNVVLIPEKYSTLAFIIVSTLKILYTVVIFFRLVINVTLIRYFVYTLYKEISDEPIQPWHNIRKRKKSYRKISNIKVSILLIFGIVINIVYMQINYDRETIITKHMNITSHRGGGFYDVENTTYAIAKGAQMGADYAEIDIRLTKDNHLILLHDSSFKRVYGVDKKPSSMTLNEIKQLKALRNNLTKDRVIQVPTLEEAIDEAIRHGIKLNIEIKGNHYEFDKIVDEAVKIVHEKDFSKKCIFTSLNLEPLKLIKDKDPKLKTGYLLIAVKGNVYDLPFIDMIGIEQSFATNTFINEVHKHGKKVCVWTINDNKTLEHFMDLGCDNIITDIANEALLVREMVEKNSIFDRKLTRFLSN